MLKDTKSLAARANGREASFAREFAAMTILMDSCLVRFQRSYEI
jgi:hypothetical protein